MTTTLTKAQRFAIMRAVDPDLNVIETGLSALAVFQDALASGANDYSTPAGEEALQHILRPMSDALARVKATLGPGESEEAATDPDEATTPETPEIDRLELEGDVVDLRNGLAALRLIGQSLEGIGVDNDELVSQGIRFTEETMRASLDSLAEKVGL